MKKTLLVLLTPLLALVTFALDQYTKYLVSTNLAVGEAWMPIQAIEPYFVIRHIRNSGAAFGMFPWAGNIFLGIAIVVTLGIARYYYQHARTAPLPVRISLGLMLGGALGNMIDRIRFGYVVDMFDLGWWPVFNIADSCVFLGVTTLALYMGLLQPQKTAEAPSETLNSAPTPLSQQQTE